jgi:hypothetical protein
MEGFDNKNLVQKTLCEEDTGAVLQR